MTAFPKKIMVAVDGSDVGFRAADFAIELARKLESEILFINVAGASSSERNYRITADMAGSFERLGSEALAKCEEDARKREVKSTTLLVAGIPGDEILANAKKMNCDCIVIGKTGLSKLGKLLMGSVSERVTREADIPVVIVK
jgi:nucleotide-binding universal stress UspA family protein